MNVPKIKSNTSIVLNSPTGPNFRNLFSMNFNTWSFSRKKEKITAKRTGKRAIPWVPNTSMIRMRDFEKIRPLIYNNKEIVNQSISPSAIHSEKLISCPICRSITPSKCVCVKYATMAVIITTKKPMISERPPAIISKGLNNHFFILFIFLKWMNTFDDFVELIANGWIAELHLCGHFF